MASISSYHSYTLTPHSSDTFSKLVYFYLIPFPLKQTTQIGYVVDVVSLSYTLTKTIYHMLHWRWIKGPCAAFQYSLINPDTLVPRKIVWINEASRYDRFLYILFPRTSVRINEASLYRHCSPGKHLGSICLVVCNRVLSCWNMITWPWFRNGTTSGTMTPSQ
jgi:hypothetical protein